MLALAHLLAREAAARYARLADCMRRVDQSAIAALLDGLAAEERTHLGRVANLAQRMVRHAPDPRLVKQIPPEALAPADELDAAALLSPYRALAIAVRAEERAFAFWTYVAAEAVDPALRELAESFARQELIHAARLRQARRRAYHADPARRPAQRVETDEAPAADDIWAAAAALERTCADFCAAAAARLRAGDAVTSQLFDDLADEARRAGAAMTPRGGPPAATSDAFARAERHGANSAALLFEAAGLIEELDDRYLDWLDTAASAEVVVELERRAAATTARLARLHERLHMLEPSLATLGAGGKGS